MKFFYKFTSQGNKQSKNYLFHKINDADFAIHVCNIFYSNNKILPLNCFWKSQVS